MEQISSIRPLILTVAFLVTFCLTRLAHAAEGLPLVLAKSGLIGFGLLFLCILLGLLAVLIPSMRKVLRKKE